MVTAKDIMQTNLITITKDANVSEVIKILGEKKITGLPVTDEDMKIEGIVSEKDVLTMAYHTIIDSENTTSKDKKVEDVMVSDVVSFRSDDNLADICQCFINNPFRRVPILEDGILVGLISRKDIITYAFSKSQ